MAPGDWAELTRAIRAEKVAQIRKCNETTGSRYEGHNNAATVLEALENVTQYMAGGRVYD